VIWNTRWLSDGEIVYTLENNGKPASIQSYNVKTKQVTDWTKERLPAQLEAKVKSPELIKWKSFDGREISGYAVRPVAAVQGKAPVLIFVHGGPPVLDKPVFNSQDIRLASNLGLTIIHTNIRGSNGFGKEFMDADNREKRVDAIKDIQSLLDWVQKQPDLDANRIYIRGESYGGFVALSIALQEPNRIKGVIAEYPLVSVRGFLSQSWIDEAAKNEYGDPKDEQLMKRLDELSPLGNTKRWNKIPLFMTRGKLDSRIPEKDVTDLKTQLQNNGTDVWFIYSNEDGHGFGGRYVFAAMYEFLKQQINK
jgi:dipeptidyl aminopeptidase/acylaminoacyl peptidase